MMGASSTAVAKFFLRFLAFVFWTEISRYRARVSSGGYLPKKERKRKIIMRKENKALSTKHGMDPIRVSWFLFGVGSLQFLLFHDWISKFCCSPMRDWQVLAHVVVTMGFDTVSGSYVFCRRSCSKE